MPQKIPNRAGGPKDFHRDSPLTEMGIHQVIFVERNLKSHFMFLCS